MLSLLTIHWMSIGLLYVLYIPQHTTAWIIHLVLSIPLLLSFVLFVCVLHLTLSALGSWIISTLWIQSPNKWPDATLAVGFSGFWKSPRVNQEKWQSQDMLPTLPCSCDYMTPGYFSTLHLVLICNLKGKKKKKKKHQCSFLLKKMSDQFMSMNIISSYLCKGYKLHMHITGNKTKYSPYHGEGCTLTEERDPWTVFSWFPK